MLKEPKIIFQLMRIFTSNLFTKTLWKSLEKLDSEVLVAQSFRLRLFL